MADIRINSLPSTATSFNTDDYIAIDGASGGTRRMLAANPPFTDVTLGASGPSVKSTLSARAPRQGLVFDTTANATVASVAAFGTSDFTIAAIVRKDSLAAAKILIGGQSNSFGLTVNTNGTVITSLVNVADNTASTGTIAAGKTAVVVYSRSGTTGTYYINGVAAGTTTDSRNYSVAFTSIGGAPGNAAVLDGSLSVLAYNRALSASEVVALYEAGAPAGADYNTPAAGSTDLKPSSGTYAYWFGTGSLSATAATSFTFASGASSLGVRNISGTITVKAGTRYRVTVVASGLNSNASFATQLVASTPATSSIANGTTTVEITFSASGSPYFSFFDITSTAGGSISISSIQALGLLLAPDAAQAGGGLTWYDTSGNAANITLPASGVSWNVPFAGYVTAPVSSDLTLAGGNSGSTLTLKKGTSLKAGLNIAAPTGYANTVFHINDTSGSTSSGIKLTNTTTGTTNDDGFDLTVSGSNALLIQRENAYMAFYTNATETMRLFANGNLFIGASPVDGGQKLQVSGTGYVSGDLTSGAILRSTGASNTIRIRGNAQYLEFTNAAESGYVTGTIIANTLNLFGNNGTGLAIGATGNATFTGSIAIGNAVTTGIAVASTHKVQISIGGTTYYLLASNV